MSDDRIRPCPKCDGPPRLLEAASHESPVYFYRCTACGHVWTVPKRDPEGPIGHVTVEPPKRGTRN